MTTTVAADNPYLQVADRAQRDFAYCCGELLWIKPKDRPLCKLALNWPQRYIWQRYLQSAWDAREPLALLVLKARREGVCLDPSTRILTADLHWIRIDETVPGDTLVAVDEAAPHVGKGPARKMRVAMVEATREVCQPAYRLFMDDGRELIATGSHRFLSRLRGGSNAVWRGVIDMRVGDVIRHVTDAPWGRPGYEDGWFGGLLDGEGTCRSKNRGGCEITITQLPGPVYDRAVKYLLERHYTFREDLDIRTRSNDHYTRQPCGRLVLHRINEIFRLVGQTQPSRFATTQWWEGKELPGKKSGVAWSSIVNIESLGLRPMIDLQTSTGTFVAEGFVSHNSTLIQAWTFHKATFYRGQQCYVTAHDDDTSQELFRMARTFYQNLHPRLRPPTIANNRMEIEYGQEWAGSSMRVRVAKYADIGHGKTIQQWHASEVGYYPIDPMTGAPAALPGLLEAVPTTGRSSIVWETTAFAADSWFHQVWVEAERNKHRRVGYGNRHWQTCFLPWHWHPDHRAVWHPDFEPLTSEERELQQRFTLSIEQLAWRRGKLAELNTEYPGQGARQFRSLYPITSEEPFLLAGTCVFPEQALDEMRRQERPPSLGFNIVQTGQWRCNLVEEKHLDEASLVMWEPPRRGCEYTLGVDVSRGVGRDDSAVVVMCMPGYAVVAHWYDNYVAPKQLAYIVAAIARFYGVRSGTHPICTVEINDAGILVNSELETLRAYEPLDIFVWEYWDKVGQQLSTKTGWQTTYRTKELLLGLANSLMLARQTFQPSHWIREDMGRTIEIRPGVARTSGCDLVIAWLLALMTAYRKIARFHDPEALLELTGRAGVVFAKSFASDEAAADMREVYGDDYTYKDKVFYDVQGDKIRRGQGENSIVGSGALW